ncbi:hypothetical protein [Bdellovibrio sp. KM01]|uniref:hypothetical protein n=1 Tax=Bdellovibrio sp. KM01 TaxID=2748865 RepID=UPI0015E96571|nr:hypothetical protein [Bdellovibrio sp. KM01]QLY26121.1 hypothetical protein HW988_03550 [Bdellovibrio sp. KM01]
MKRINLTLISILTLPAITQAKTKTLLYCKDISQPDLKTITIQENTAIKQEGLLELIEDHKDGSKKELYAMDTSLTEGWIPMSPINGTQRVLVKKEGKWSVAENKGEYRIFNDANCVK